VAALAVDEGAAAVRAVGGARQDDLANPDGASAWHGSGSFVHVFYFGQHERIRTSVRCQERVGRRDATVPRKGALEVEGRGVTLVRMGDR
jgi:hypothetical protein